MNTTKDLQWKPYLDDRVISEHPLGYSIVMPRDYDLSRSSVFCEICDEIMTSMYDEEAVKKFACCDACASKWAHPNQEAWSRGWRPSKSDVESTLKIRRCRT